MGRFWDERAQEDPFYFVDNNLQYGHPDVEAFWRGGQRDLDGMLDALGLEIGAEDVALDIGCGLGRLSRVMASRAESVWALDASKEMLRRAQELNPQLENVTWVEGDGQSLTGVPDQGVTIVLSHVVFQHIPDPEVTLRYVSEMGRVLRPGGRAGFQISNDPSIHRRRWGPRQWKVRLASLVGRAPKRQSHDAWRGSAVDLDDLRRTADAAGMDVERVVGEGTQFCYVRLSRR